jgi:hypothetical protein
MTLGELVNYFENTAHFDRNELKYAIERKVHSATRNLNFIEFKNFVNRTLRNTNLWRKIQRSEKAQLEYECFLQQLKYDEMYGTFTQEDEEQYDLMIENKYARLSTDELRNIFDLQLRNDYLWKNTSVQTQPEFDCVVMKHAIQANMTYHESLYDKQSPFEYLADKLKQHKTATQYAMA